MLSLHGADQSFGIPADLCRHLCVANYDLIRSLDHGPLPPLTLFP
jgi:hypothetical protein